MKAIQSVRPGWQHIVLVCRACEKRKKGPKAGFGAKDVAKALSAAMRAARVPKSRIVLTTCMGICPKRAVAVAAAAPEGRVGVVAWHKSDDPQAAVALLFPEHPSPSTPLEPT